MLIIRRFVEVMRIPLFILCSGLIIFVGLFFDVPFMIPPFVGSLYILYMEQGVMFKNIVGGHIIGLACAFIEPIILFYADLSFLPDVFVKAFIIAIAIAACTFFMSITALKHEPAIATVLLFFEIGHSQELLFGLVPWMHVLMFFAGLIMVSFMSWIYLRSR